MDTIKHQLKDLYKTVNGLRIDANYLGDVASEGNLFNIEVRVKELYDFVTNCEQCVAFTKSEDLTKVITFMEKYGDAVTLSHSNNNWYVPRIKGANYLGAEILLPIHRALNSLTLKETEEVKRLYL